ncbi:MAG TPA: polysaccharide deacetylase family protein [Kineosporiaceae bacterium]
MDRRRFLGRTGTAVAGAALGGSAAAGLGALQVRATRQSWASTISPADVPGAVRTWWSGDVAVGRVVALTFDDGPTEQFTGHLLDLLAGAGVRATFFVIGALAERHPDLLRRVRDAGHELGNHTYDHYSAAVRDRDQVREAVLRGSDVIERVTGARPRWLRPPRGEVTTATLLAAREAGLDLALWSVARGDAADADGAGVLRHLTTALHPGAVVDLHDGIGRSSFSGSPDGDLLIRRRAELGVLPQALGRWQADGYRFAALSELIPGTPGIPGTLGGPPTPGRTGPG